MLIYILLYQICVFKDHVCVCVCVCVVITIKLKYCNILYKKLYKIIHVTHVFDNIYMLFRKEGCVQYIRFF